MFRNLQWVVLKRDWFLSGGRLRRGELVYIVRPYFDDDDGAIPEGAEPYAYRVCSTTGLKGSVDSNLLEAATQEDIDALPLSQEEQPITTQVVVARQNPTWEDFVASTIAASQNAPPEPVEYVTTGNYEVPVQVASDDMLDAARHSSSPAYYDPF